MGAKRLVTMGLTALILLGVWAIYLVPVASVLDVGFGQSGFRNYDPYVYVLVSSVHRTSAGVGFDTYASDVLSCLPEGSSASRVAPAWSKRSLARRVGLGV